MAVLRNEEGVAFDDQLVLITVELPKFDKSAAACVTDLDKLIFTMQNAHKITDLSLFPKFWDEHWIRIALEEVDTRAMTPEQLLQFEMQLSANAIAVKHAQRALDEAKAAGNIQGREQLQISTIRRLLLKGKGFVEVADDLDVPLALVEAQREQLRREGLL